MIIHNLNLINFRSYQNIIFNFNKGLNIIIGKNAQGKTNIIEGIYVLGLIKSFLKVTDQELIKFDEDFATIKGNVFINNKKKHLQIVIGKNNKRIKINQNTIRKNSDYISKLNIILFNSQCLDLIKGQPLDKRRFLNIEISQLNKKYFILLSEYNKVLKIRNEYLKNNHDKFDNIYYNIVTTKLIEISLKIYNERVNFINNINNYINECFKKITNSNNNLLIKYESSVNYEDSFENLIKYYQKNVTKELKYQTTMFGPHRDSFKIYLDDLAMDIYCSQGQQRLAIIALKLAEINIFKKETGENPIILLDDIFSELDSEKQNNLMNYLNFKYQVIMTTTDINNINNKLIKKAQIIKIDNSEIIEVIKK